MPPPVTVDLAQNLRESACEDPLRGTLPVVDTLTVGEVGAFGVRAYGWGRCEHDRAERIVDVVEAHDASVLANVPPPARPRFMWFGR